MRKTKKGSKKKQENYYEHREKRNLQSNAYYAAHKKECNEHSREYRRQHLEELKVKRLAKRTSATLTAKREHAKAWRLQNPEAAKEKAKKNYAKHKEKIKVKVKAWKESHKEHVRTWAREYYKKNVNHKLGHAFRCRLRTILRAHLKTQNSPHIQQLELLCGCDAEQLKAHLESLWKPGMTWENWTSAGWHIDHIIPCNSFDLTDEKQQQQCFHYSNLQPLWAVENLQKGRTKP